MSMRTYKSNVIKYSPVESRGLENLCLHLKKELSHLESLAVFELVCLFRRKKMQGKTKNRQKLNG